MPIHFVYSKEKDLILRATRSIGFTEIIQAIKEGHVLAEYQHLNQKKYPGQRLLIVKINQYAYVVPYIIDQKRNIKYLKTAYPSRKMTKKYQKKGKL